MGFTVYKHPEKDEDLLDSTREWRWNMYYHDGCEGGKQREKDLAKICKEDGCKVVWDKVK